MKVVLRNGEGDWIPAVTCLDWHRGPAGLVTLGVLMFGASPGLVGAARLRLRTGSVAAS